MTEIRVRKEIGSAQPDPIIWQLSLRAGALRTNA
jgi:hypothetical protein